MSPAKSRSIAWSHRPRMARSGGSRPRLHVAVLVGSVIGLPGIALGCGSSGADGDAQDTERDGEETQGESTATTGEPASSSGASEHSSGSASDTGRPATTGDANLCGDGPPMLALGHGSDGFAPLDSGPAELFYGPQGGVHIFMGLRSPGLDASRLGELRMRAFLGDRMVADQPEGAILVCPPASAPRKPPRSS